MSNKDESKVAGGEARAASLTAEQRKVIAKKAAEERWGTNLPPSLYEGEFPIGDRSISCAVLDDGLRIITQATFLRALGRSRSPKAGTGVLSTVDNLPFFLQSEALKPFIDNELKESTTPIFYKTKSGGKSVGYDANLLPRVADIYLQWRDSYLIRGKKIPPRNEKMFTAADLLMRGLAHVGIVALVDEATGYQDARSRDALAKILESFIDKELQPWTKTFPEAFYKEIFRLRGWSYKALAEGQKPQRPSVLGKYTIDLIYERLAPGVYEELKRINPKTVKGNRKTHHHRWFTQELGHPKLAAHIEAITALARISPNWEFFLLNVKKAYPKRGTTIPMDI